MGAPEVMPLPVDISGGVDDFVYNLGVFADGIASTYLYRGHGIPGWVGKSADVYTDQINKLSQRTHNLVLPFADLRVVLNEWVIANQEACSRIRHLWVEYEFALNKKEDTAAILENYKQVIDGLDRAAGGLAKKVWELINNVVHPDVVGRGRDAIGAKLFGDLPLVNAQAHWSLGNVKASQAAGYLLNPNLTSAEVREFHKNFKEYYEDPYFALALSQRVSPDAVVGFLGRSKSYYGHGDIGLDKTIDSVVGGISSVTVLSLGGISTSNKNLQLSFETHRAALKTAGGSSMDSVVRENIKAWKRTGKTLYDHDGSTVDGQHYCAGSGQHYGYEYLGVMFNKAAQNKDLSLGAEVFTSIAGETALANEIVRWDYEHHDQIANHGSYGSWDRGLVPGGFRAGPDLIDGMLELADRPAGIGQKMSSGDLLYQHNQKLHDSVQGFLSGDTSFEVSADKVASRPYTDFGKDGSMPMNMTRYLTGFRVTEFYSGTTNKGESLGRVIAQSSLVGDPPSGSGYEEWLSHQKKAKRIAGNFLLGYQEGLEIYPPISGENPFGSQHSGLRSWFGEIMAPHAKDLADELYSPNHGGHDVGVRLSYGNSLNSHQLEIGEDLQLRLLSPTGAFVDIGFDELRHDNGTPNDPSDDYNNGRSSAVKTLLAATREGYKADLLKNYESNDFQVVHNHWAALYNPVLTAPEYADATAKEAINQQNKLPRAVSVMAIGTVAPAVPAGEMGSLVKGATYFGQDPVLDWLFPTDLNNDVGIANAKKLAKDIMFGDYHSAFASDPRILENPNVRSSLQGVLNSGNGILDENGRLKPYEKMDDEGSSENKKAFESSLLNAGDKWLDPKGNIEAALREAQDGRYR